MVSSVGCDGEFRAALRPSRPPELLFFLFVLPENTAPCPRVAPPVPEVYRGHDNSRSLKGGRRQPSTSPRQKSFLVPAVWEPPSAAPQLCSGHRGSVWLAWLAVVLCRRTEILWAEPVVTGMDRVSTAGSAEGTAGNSNTSSSSKGEDPEQGSGLVVTPEAQSSGTKDLLGVVGEVGCEEGFRTRRREFRNTCVALPVHASVHVPQEQKEVHLITVVDPVGEDDVHRDQVLQVHAQDGDLEAVAFVEGLSHFEIAQI
ncbi:hypothetical protein EYF80_031458 [Liparis tanakae]|uniref:Uncharacterized protein n=1 Tax=Liparis tanakae TaxID=230148 RepID=A0A4Z2GXU3_9TELE|nr:hypothetical protein EYF80_031458 [Liparis tanakae]